MQPEKTKNTQVCVCVCPKCNNDFTNKIQAVTGPKCVGLAVDLVVNGEGVDGHTRTTTHSHTHSISLSPFLSLTPTHALAVR